MNIRPIHRCLFKKLLHQGGTYLLFPPFLFFGLASPKDRSAVWMQSTEICMRTEGDHRRPLWTFLFFLSFFFLSTPQSQITESFHGENSVIFSCLISSSFTLKNKLNFTLEMTSFNDCLNSHKGSRVNN